jgi:hypothetical protein
VRLLQDTFEIIFATSPRSSYLFDAGLLSSVTNTFIARRNAPVSNYLRIWHSAVLMRSCCKIWHMENSSLCSAAPATSVGFLATCIEMDTCSPARGTCISAGLLEALRVSAGGTVIWLPFRVPHWEVCPVC